MMDKTKYLLKRIQNVRKVIKTFISFRYSVDVVFHALVIPQTLWTLTQPLEHAHGTLTHTHTHTYTHMIWTLYHLADYFDERLCVLL